MSVFNDFNGHAGDGYSRPASIPQGCPLPMLWLSLAMRPLLLRLRALGAIPRALADDMLLYKTGRAHWRVAKEAGSCVHSCMNDLGAKVAPKKPLAFSTDPIVRKAMRLYRWPVLDHIIPVACASMDLGAHISFGAVMRSCTLKARLTKAARVIDHVASLPGTRKLKNNLIRTTGLAMALYGVECTAAPHRSHHAFCC